MTHGPETSLVSGLLRLDLPSRIMAIIEDAGGEARLVGGAVRDVLAGMPLADDADIDMATTLLPAQAATALKSAGLRVIPTGIDHGTITVMKKDSGKACQKVELTTLRQDIRTDGRHAEVVFGTDWMADAARRDFTINSLYADQSGQIYDPFGGLDDLKAGRVRFIGEPEARIREDYLRMLRYFRFFGRFSRTGPDAAAMAAIRHHSSGLGQISGERIAAELRGILQTRSVPAIEALVASGLDREIAATGFNAAGYGDLVAAVPDIPVMIALGLLLGDASPEPVAQRLRLSNAEQRLLLAATTPVDAGSLEQKDWQRQAWRLARQGQHDAETLAFIYAAQVIRDQRRFDLMAFARLRNWQMPVFPVTGGDLLEHGYNEGAELGKALQSLEASWVERDFLPGREALLNMLDASPLKR